MQAFVFSKTGLAAIVFLVIGGYFLWAEHQAHVIAVLPWLLVGGCLVMHLFMHHGHRDHGSGIEPEERDVEALTDGEQKL